MSQTKSKWIAQQRIVEHPNVPRSNHNLMGFFKWLNGFPIGLCQCGNFASTESVPTFTVALYTGAGLLH
jgi:hypothetical protein